MKFAGFRKLLMPNFSLPITSFILFKCYIYS